MSSEEGGEAQLATTLQVYILYYLNEEQSKHTQKEQHIDEQNLAANHPGFVTVRHLINSIPSSMATKVPTTSKEIYTQLISLEERGLLRQKREEDIESSSFSITGDGILAIKLYLARLPHIVDYVVQRHSPDSAEFILNLNARMGEMEREIKKLTSITESPPSAPASINITGSHFSNSPVQVANKDSSQNITVIDQKQSIGIKEIVAELKRILSEQQIPAERKQELESDVKTIESQLSSPKPKTRIIKETLSSSRGALEDLSSIAVGVSLLITKITSWMHGVP